jgi:hypothetical protein
MCTIVLLRYLRSYGHLARIWKQAVCTEFRWGNLLQRDKSEVKRNEKLILKQIFKK